MEFVTTETELKAIAIEAKTGFNRKPFIGYKKSLTQQIRKYFFCLKNYHDFISFFFYFFY